MISDKTIIKNLFVDEGEDKINWIIIISWQKRAFMYCFGLLKDLPFYKKPFPKTLKIELWTERRE